MTRERIEQLRKLLATSTLVPWNAEALRSILRFAKKNGGPWDECDDDNLWFPAEKDAELIVEMRASLEELLAIAEKPGREGW
jgi:hypothetical protein